MFSLQFSFCASHRESFLGTDDKMKARPRASLHNFCGLGRGHWCQPRRRGARMDSGKLRRSGV